MANFSTHFNVAFAASGITGLLFFKAGMLTPVWYLGCVVMGTIGGLLPDIDSEYSTPVRVGFRVISLAVAFALVIYLISQLSVMELIAVWAVAYVTMRHGILRLYSHLTVHRGMVHSVPYMLLLALLVVYSYYYLFGKPAIYCWFLGFFLLFGTLVHLVLDELYSVNLLGMRLKKSAGTALKFFSLSQKAEYLGLYLLLIPAVYFSPPFGPFWQLISDPARWQLLRQNLYPAGLA